jgi:hypothetical protein
MEDDILELDVDLPEGLDEILGPQPVGIIVLDSEEALELAGIGVAVGAVARTANSVFRGTEGFWITTRSGARVFITQEAAGKASSAARVVAGGGVSESERRMVAAAFNKLPQALRDEIRTIRVLPNAPTQSRAAIAGKTLAEFDATDYSLNFYMSALRKNPEYLVPYTMAHESAHALYASKIVAAGEGTPLNNSRLAFRAASLREDGATEYANRYRNELPKLQNTNPQKHNAMQNLYVNENFAEYHALYRMAKNDASGASKVLWDLVAQGRPQSTSSFLDMMRLTGGA